ncbi:hypothetical protein BDR26DRAFT_858657 [Obelidium mucronatum]|nr:hypothetical protein BDR26DRAFT_858657 [Obelidium mucronatum]
MPVLSTEEVQVINTNQDQGSAPSKRTIAIAVESSKFSEHAFNWAVENYLRPDDFVILLNVQHQTAATVGTSGLDAFGGAADQELFAAYGKKESHELLTRYATVLGEKQFQFRALSIVGQTKEALVHKVQELNATTVIVGSRGLNKVSLSLLGSTSDYLAHHCHCPVLIVKPTVAELKAIKGVSHAAAEKHEVFSEEGFTGSPASIVKVL